MTDQEIRTAFERDGYAVVKDLVDTRDLGPICDFIKAKVDAYSRELYREGKLSSCYETESFGRRYAAVCEELGISPRSWDFGMFGPEFYDLYNLPGVLNVVHLLLGPEVLNVGTPALRTKLPGSMVTSFPWHQDSQYFDQLTIGKKEKHTGGLRMVTVWLPLVEATVENGCCWVLPGSHRWGLLDGARGADLNVRMEEDIEARGNPVPVPLEPGGALFLSNLCVHTSKVNRTRECRWSIDFRCFPTPERADLTAGERRAAEYAKNKILAGGRVPLVVLTEGRKPTWEEWEAEHGKLA